MVRVVASEDKRIPVGYNIATINDQPIEDFLEFQFYNDISKTRRMLIKSNGTSKSIVYKPHENIAVTIESPRYRQCTNNCDFCFINGLPANLRKELYFRDDDYRLSFLFGNFLSLTNIDQADIARIGRLRLSPLYVSVHTTDPKRRISLFKNKKAGIILETIKQIIDNDVKIHCQIVVIPGITSGRSLARTIKDLSQLYPGVASIGVVPVGKTKYIRGIQSVSKKLACSIIDFTQSLQNGFRKRYNRGLVYLADEFYIKAEHQIPDRRHYDDLPQYENGIGMVRSILDEISSIRKVKRTKKKYLLLTGKSAFPFMRILRARMQPNIKVDIKAVKNDLFGNTVTVSGLLGARDMKRRIARLTTTYDRIFLPPDCINENHEFLDGGIIEDPRVMVAPGSIKELLKCLQ
jgi:putative radical SAM enzyme (TIGR03279 family)